MIVFLAIILPIFSALPAHAVDTTPPITTAAPAGGTYNTTQSVTLTANETSSIFYTTNGSTPTTGSAVYSAPIDISVNTVLKFFAMDEFDNVETVQTVTYTFETTPPTGSIIINNGDDITPQAAVMLTLSCADANGCSQMKFSNDDIAWSTAEAYATGKSWTLSAGDGAKTVYVKFKDATGNWSNPYGDSIALDTTIPVGQVINLLPKTGQTTCYNASGSVISCAGTGQDGELQIGATWPNPRFMPSSSGTGTVVTDNLTGLVWTQDAKAPGPSDCGPGTTKTWQGALDYVACLNTNSYLGHNDWRLPNVNELRSLVNDGQAISVSWLSTQGFDNAQAVGYWSSTSYIIVSDVAWFVRVSDGYVNCNGKAYSLYYVWPVRAGQSGLFANSIISLFRTGQTTCYNASGSVISCAGTGQDGELQIGATWPNPRFMPSSSGTGTVVTDNLTGLVWTQDANAPGPSACGPGTTKTWQGALAYVACLNANSYLGHIDWRLPNVTELKSLINSEQANSASWLNTQGYNNAQANYYWSSTSYADDAFVAWLVNMIDGFVSSSSKGSSLYVWPVRSGQSGPYDSSGIFISRGVAASKNLTVPIQLNATHANGVAEMKFSDDNVNWSAPVSYATTTNYTLPTGDGTKTVYVRFRANGNTSWSLVYSDSIILDTTASVTTATPASGLYSSMSVTLTANEAGSTIYYTLDGSTPTTSSTVYSTPISITSNKTLKFFAVDSIGNAEAVKTETYTIDTVLPSGSVVINGGATETGSYNVTLTLSATDASGISEMKFRNENTTEWTTPEFYATSKSWTLSPGEGTKTVYAKFKDTAGNWSVSATKSITVNTPPQGGSDFMTLPKTGQTTCYSVSGSVISCAGTGQDGELQAGATWPNPRFTPSSSGTGTVVTDNLTGLVWTQDANAPGPTACGPGTTKTWQGALDYVACLNTNNYLGHNDWRLPNVNELRSIVDNEQPNSASWLNTQGFVNAQTGSYWSSTSSTNYRYYSWGVYMSVGYVFYHDKANSNYVWPIRAGQSGSFGSSGISLFKTGQTICYNASGSVISCEGTGQDGELQIGAIWPNPRFTPSSSGTGTVVTDSLTGLIWTQDANAPGPLACGPGTTKTWQGAFDYVACLNTNSYLGHTDWRLPNVNELRSLVNNGQANPASWLNSQGFNNAQADYYWSSTTYTISGGYAWLVNMYDGYVYGNDKTYSYYVWPVRAGLSGSFGSSGILIARGAAVSKGLSVPLQLRAEDANGVAEMTLSNDGINWSTPESFAFGKQWTLSSGDGTKTVYVKFKDSTGLWSDVYSDTIILDTTPPVTSLDSKPASITNSTNAAFTFTSESGATIECQLDSNGYSACTSPVSYSGLSAGNHAFFVRAKDTVGNVESPVSYSWTIDLTAPTLIISAPSITITNNSNVTYTVTYTGADSATLVNSNVTLNKTGTANGTVGVSGSGNTRTVTITGIVGDGTLGISISAGTAGDIAGNAAGAVGPSATFTVDNTPPQGNSDFSMLPKTGQTTSYAAADDGAIKIGAAWPNSRFVDNGDETLTDKLTGLIWTKDGNSPGPAACGAGTYKSWQGALDYAVCLNTNNYLGHNDWRLPNVSELRSIINDGQTDSAAWLNTQGFVNSVSDYYWTSTTAMNNTEGSWAVDFGHSVVNNMTKGMSYYARCVRGGQSGSFDSSAISLFRTGQTICYGGNGGVISCAGSHQDGELQVGESWPDPRFLDTGDETITDRLTGLIWTKDGNAPGPPACGPGTIKTWQSAFNYAACLNANNYLGHNDWRLPNVIELRSLVNSDQIDSAIWLNTQGFVGSVSSVYWSSTTMIGNVAVAYVVNQYGHESIYDKSESNNVRCVRGQQSFDSIGVLVNWGIAATNVRFALLTFSVSDYNGVTEVALSNDNITWSTPEAFRRLKEWTLSDGDGTKTVYVKFKDSTGLWSDVYSDTIELYADHAAPTTPTVKINNDVGYVNSTSATLNLTATDETGVTGYFISTLSTTPSATDAGWTTISTALNFSANVSYTLTSGDGQKTVYAWFKDAEGNVSVMASGSIILDTSMPNVSAGPDRTKNAAFTQTAIVTDPNIVSYHWALHSGPAGGTINFGSSTTISTTISANVAGTYVIRFTAADGAGNSAYSDMTLVWDTTAPTVNAGSNQTKSALFTQTATASDATALTYNWTKQSGPGTITFGSATALSTTIVATTDGTYSLRLTATDAAGNSAYSDMTLVWDSTAPIVNAGSNQTKNAQFTQTATANDATALTYNWTKQSGPGTITFGSATALSTTIAATADGTYSLRLTATDAAGNSTYSDMTLVWDTTTPTVNAGSNQAKNALFTQMATASDSTALTYNWTTQNGPGTITFGSASALSTTIAATADGIYTLRLTVTDAAGNSAYSVMTLVWDTTTPIVNAGSDQTKNVQFTLTATANDASALTYNWAKQSGPGTITFGSSTALSTTVAATIDGTYVIRITATDAAGNSAYSDMTLSWDTVAPNAPVVSGTTPNSSTSPIWNWTTGGNGNGTFQYKLDSGSWTNTTAMIYQPGSALSEGTHTLFVQEKDTAGNSSSSGSFAILIDKTAPVTSASASAGLYKAVQNITLTCNDGAGTSGCKAIYYTTNGTEPTLASAQYSAPIPVSATTTLKFMSVDFAGNTESINTLNYVIDMTLPTVSITSPQNAIQVDYLDEISGTAFDAQSGVALVEVQIIYGTKYLNAAGSFTTTPAWLLADGTTTWSYFMSSGIWNNNATYTVKARATDTAGNVAAISQVTFTKVLVIEQAFTTLSLDLSSQTMLQNETVNVSGKLTRMPDNATNLDGRPVRLTITAPDATTQLLDATTYDIYGHYIFNNVSVFTQKGTYGVKTSFAGSQLLAASTSETKSVLVGASAGYAIIVEGKIANEEGLGSHNKTANRIYQKLLDRGFVDDNIQYFNYNTTQAGVDSVPSRGAIQFAIETWAKNKMNGSPAPLFLIMVDHGNPNTFYLGSETIAPADIAAWLATLEIGLTGPAVAEKRVVIIGSCYSGSFISALAHENRIIISSAAPDEESYKGPNEPDNVRSGEYFLEEFFKELGHGQSLSKAFVAATDKTEVYTRKGGSSTNSGNPSKYLDNAMQHPLLDDNSDGKGSNILSEDDGDGAAAANMYLGIGVNYDTNSANNPADITSMTETLHVSSSITTTLLWAKANDDSQVSSAWYEVRSPSMTLSATGGSNQLEVALTKVLMTRNNATGRWEAAFTQFIESGMYEVFYFVRDVDTNDISQLKRSVVYKNKAGNNAPTAFNPLSPADATEQKTVLLFNWEASTDPDSNPITYSLLLSRDATFGTVDYRIEEIEGASAAVGLDAKLLDLTTYYWKIKSIDSYGAFIETSVRSFTTNNTNGLPGIISGYVIDAGTQAPVAAATISITGAGSTTSAPNGAYLMTLPTGNATITASATGYQSAPGISVTIAPGDTIRKNISLASTVAPQYALNTIKAGIGAGTVTSAPTGINCGSDCTESYTSGTEVTLTAAPAPGSSFAGWSGAGCSGTGTCVVTMNVQQSVTATFTLNTFSVTPSAGTNGSISPNTVQTVISNSTTSFTVTPNSGYAAQMGGTCNGTLTGTTYTTNPITANCTVTATFTANPVNGACGSSNGQTLSSAPSANFCNAGNSSLITGSGPWTWSCGGLNSGTTATCSASIQTYTVTPSAGTGGSISPSTPQTINSNSTTSFTVTPSSGYSINAVTGCNGTLINTTYTIGSITANCTVTATFTKNQQISQSGDMDGNGTVEAADALSALRIVAGLQASTSSDLSRGDVAPLVNSIPQPDGKLDLGDVVVILRRAVGLVTW